MGDETEEHLREAEELGFVVFALLSRAPSIGTAVAALGMALGLMTSEWIAKNKRKQFVDDACQAAHAFVDARSHDPGFWPSGRHKKKGVRRGRKQQN